VPVGQDKSCPGPAVRYQPGSPIKTSHFLHLAPQRNAAGGKAKIDWKRLKVDFPAKCPQRRGSAHVDSIMGGGKTAEGQH